MSRSDHNGCGGPCGVCKPHKKWKSNAVEDQRPAVRRALQDVPEDAIPVAEEGTLLRCQCGELADWEYPGRDGHFICDNCIPRGQCSCTIDEDGNQERGDDGRELPCVDYMWIGGAR